MTGRVRECSESAGDRGLRIGIACIGFAERGFRGFVRCEVLSGEGEQ